MKFPPLTDARILARYKRFFADVELAGGEIATAHCANTGAMTTCWKPGAPAQVSAADNPRRKLKWTLERVDMGGGWVGVNTARVNPIIAAFIAAGGIPALRGYDAIRREPACRAPGFGNARLDLRLEAAARRDCLVEVKNATLLDGDCITFPDAVTARGRKHLELLRHAANAGHRALLLFAVNRPEGAAFRPAAAIDRAYAGALKRAAAGGVEVIAVRIRHTADGVEPGGEVPVALA